MYAMCVQMCWRACFIVFFFVWVHVFLFVFQMNSFLHSLVYTTQVCKTKFKIWILNDACLQYWRIMMHQIRAQCLCTQFGKVYDCTLLIQTLCVYSRKFHRIRIRISNMSAAQNCIVHSTHNVVCICKAITEVHCSLYVHISTLHYNLFV